MRVCGAVMALAMLGCTHHAAPVAEPATQPEATRHADPLADRDILTALGMQPASKRARGEWRPKHPRAPILPRPAVQLPALPISALMRRSGLATWPLTSVPAMQPHALALVGDAPSCTPQTQTETLAARYAAAWCQIRHSSEERARAADTLFALAGEATGDTRTAILRDLAEVLVDTAPLGEVIARLRASPLRGLRDTLVATYVENGNDAAAVALARAQRPDPTLPGTTPDCEQLVRDADLLGDLGPARNEPSCAKLLAANFCGELLRRLERGDSDTPPLTPSTACNETLARRDATSREVELRLAYHTWSSEAGFPEGWLAIAGHAERAMPLPGAAELGLAALENAAAVADCTEDTRSAIRSYAYIFEAAFVAQPMRLPRLVELQTFSTTCDEPGETR